MSGRWKVLVTRRAERDIAGLEVVVRKRIRRALDALSSNPLANARKLSDNELGDFRVRVGD